ncbi:serine/threonine-protein kinase fused-like [Macrosteles quadrilineatus]|uniref:serine/threonine-protein kinase fused-like n=1 Tax=Macrosteles quadrilineatus TaxID=74068 RepID=UPI0023E0C4D9|nr:serine/threonine-protein kinase fused-like [Macrosteles quadrilineatus]
MENYKILCLVGEGSFGRVFKVKKRDTKEIVALKIIRKCGRTQKELTSLRSECEIQQHLHHRNIIQMINSFETETEIVVVTEFCKRDLHYILSKQTYLSEEVALPIICDLISALYYLHSNRVLHRDLKPQNVLITEEGVAKLCDFGFARSMSRGTHVLTSIKGTPLYMAPELIEESPYDHNADLWSLGCIIYEMLVGAPPFTTNSILQLVRMIRYEPVHWPLYLSPQCRDLLQGLLHKDPSHRLSWPRLLKHPFLQGKVSDLSASGMSLPLTKELSASQALAKESQKQDLVHKAEVANQGLPQKIQHILDKEKKLLRGDGLTAIDLETLEQKLSRLQTVEPQVTEPEVTTVSEATQDDPPSETDSERMATPLEAEEWLVFLQQSMMEVMQGDVESMSEKSFITMVTNALTNHGAAPKITEYIACLLALPYVAPGVTKSELSTITKVYIEVKVVSSLMFALKLLTNRAGCSASHDSVSEHSKVTVDQLLALERVLVLVNQLVHSDQVFLSQFCDVVALLHLAPRLHLLLNFHKSKPRLALDLVSILTHILRQMPENANLVDNCVQPELSTGIDWHLVLKFGNKTLQTRTCLLLQLMARYCTQTVQSAWHIKLHRYIDALRFDSSQDLRCAAEDVIELVQDLPFFDQISSQLDDELL